MEQRPDLRDSDETVELLRRARDGDRLALDELLGKHRDRLLRMVQLRMARRLRRRIDASDVVQEALIEASRRLGDFVEKRERRDGKRSLSFFLWLRWLTRERLVSLHRRHLGTLARDARREVPIHLGPRPEASSEALAAQLLGRLSTPSQALVRAETRARLQEALNAMDAGEREILALRHFEQLSNREAARELEITEAAASKRYVRALARLRGFLAGLQSRP